MNLSEIYQPTADDLNTVEDFLRSSLGESIDQSVSAMSNLLLESAGKRIRPALVILSERAASAGSKRTCNHGRLIEIATAVELIHMASLIHDDVLDKATMRHTMPSINCEYGDDISVILSEESELGKHPGQDVIVGDITLPLLTLLEVLSQPEREELRNMLGTQKRQKQPGKTESNARQFRCSVQDR